VPWVQLVPLPDNESGLQCNIFTTHSRKPTLESKGWATTELSEALNFIILSRN